MTSVPTETLRFLMIFFGVSAGVAFVALLSRESGVGGKRWFRATAAIGAWVVLSVAGVVLFVNDQAIGAVAAMVVGFFFLYFILGAECDWGRQVFAWACIVSAIGAVGGGVLHSREMDLVRKDNALEKLRENSLRDFARIVQKGRKGWTPGPGVGEATAGALVAWATIESQIEVDAEHERWLGRHCSREIPIHLILLNNSYRPLDITLGNENLWQVRILDSDSNVLRQWEFKPGGSMVTLAAAGRERFEMTWDGRDEEGKLLEAGTYAVHFQVLGNRPSGKPSKGHVVFEIINAGPMVIVEGPTDGGDPHEELMERIHREQETTRLWDWPHRLMPSL